MKKIFLIAFTLILGLGSMCAQGNGRKSRAEMKKEFKEFKMKFIAQEVDLQDDQQKQFFELYEQMSDERMQVFEQTRRLERKVKKDPQATDEDYAAVSRAITEAQGEGCGDRENMMPNSRLS